MNHAKHRPSIKSLQYLLALHQQQNFNKAAQACFVSQSTLSAAIQNLEEQLACQLLEREHKRFIFTPKGEELVKRSADILTRMDDLVAYCQNDGDDMAGTLSIGCIPTIAPFIIPKLIDELELRYPKLELYIKEDTTENIVTQMHQAQLDFLLLALPVDTSGLIVKKIAKDPFKLVGSSDVLARFPASGLGQEVPDQSIFLLEKEHCISQHAVDACDLKGSAKIHPFSATSLYTLVQMMRKAKAASYLPQMAIDSGILAGSGLQVRNLGESASRDIGVAWRANSARLKTYQILSECIATLLHDK